MIGYEKLPAMLSILHGSLDVIDRHKWEVREYGLLLSLSG